MTACEVEVTKNGTKKACGTPSVGCVVSHATGEFNGCAVSACAAHKEAAKHPAATAFTFVSNSWERMVD